jgi:hypothetical protein
VCAERNIFGAFAPVLSLDVKSVKSFQKKKILF